MRVLRFIFPLLLVLLPVLPASSQSLDATRARKSKLEKDIRVLEKQINDTRNKQDNAARELELVSAQTTARRELLRESDSELKYLTDSLRRCQRRLEATNSRLDTLTKSYEVLVHNAYRSRDARLWYMYILASENIGQGMRRFGYLKRLSAEMNKRGRQIKAERDTLEATKARIESLRGEARKLRDQRANEVEKLRREEQKSRDLVTRLRNDSRKYTSQLAQKRKEVEELNRQIQKMIDEAMDGGKDKGGKKGGTGKKTSTRIDTALSQEFSANKGKLPWPAEGRVVSHFGRNPHPVYTKLEMPFNNGVGLTLDRDAPVKAVFNGVVKQIVMIPGYNQCVLVQHGEYFTFYCKLGSVAVKAGDKVKTGQVLGHVATIADETQLHFQLWKGKDPQDPEKWLKK